MTIPYFRYLIFLVLFTFLIGGFANFILTFVPDKIHVPPAELSGLFVFFLVTTAVIHYFLKKSSEKRPQDFVRAFMVSFLIKMVLYILLLLIYIAINKPGIVKFASAFLFLYVCYTTFEVVMLLRKAPKNHT